MSEVVFMSDNFVLTSCVCELVWVCVCLWVCYLSLLHYNQPSLVEDRDSFCTAMSHNSTGLILHQHSEWTLFSVTHILLMVKVEEDKRRERVERWNEICDTSVLYYPPWSSFWISYLDQDILAEAREGIFEAIKTDVMPLTHSAAHTIAHLLCAAPLPVLTHTVNEKAC